MGEESAGQGGSIQRLREGVFCGCADYTLQCEVCLSGSMAKRIIGNKRRGGRRRAGGRGS
jgi:hypothetical protein